MAELTVNNPLYNPNDRDEGTDIEYWRFTIDSDNDFTVMEKRRWADEWYTDEWTLTIPAWVWAQVIVWLKGIY